MRKAIVGHAADKFTPVTEAEARRIIAKILQPGDVLVSGGCHLSGIDIWAEEIARELGCYDPDYIFPPKNLRWSPEGYRDRNLKIAQACEEAHVIVVKDYPPSYDGRKFDLCYHCKTSDHVKSGGCWTAWRALDMGKPAHWHIIGRSGSETKIRHEHPT